MLSENKPKRSTVTMKSQSILLCFLLFVAVATATAFAADSMRGVGSMPGGWTPIKNLNDPHVKEIAQYAVKENNSRSNTNLKLESIVKGETQVVAGVNYRLVLAVNGGVSKKYEAVVWEKSWEKFMNLTSFKPVKG